MTMQDAIRLSGVRHKSLLLLLVLLAVPMVWFIRHNALLYVAYDAASYGGFWARRFGLIPHIAAGVVAILTGLVQTWLGATGRTRRLHRRLGQVYVSAVAVGSAAGFYLASTTGAALSYSSGLFFLSFAWALTTGIAFVAARRKSFAQHREWMTRSYAVTFAFVTFRLFEQILSSLNVAPLAEIDAAMAWACWAVPLLLIEPVLQYRKLARAPVAVREERR